jgi:hypothetical protein
MLPARRIGFRSPSQGGAERNLEWLDSLLEARTGGGNSRNVAVPAAIQPEFRVLSTRFMIS